MVDFPISGLNMQPFTLDLQDNQTQVNYDLYAVSNHFGSLNGGHYTASCKNSMLDKWYYFDDSQVFPLNLPRDMNKIVSSSAYLLWYRRRD